MATIVERAPAKVNLTLAVLGRRPDGYHEIESLVAFAEEAADEVVLETGGEAAVRVAGPFAASLVGENIVSITFDRLRRAEPRLGLGTVTIEKNLPVAAGLGGGSADAAALLRAARRANPELAGAVDWRGVARGLGADVPVCLESRASLACGLGERVTALADPPPLFAVLVNPMSPVLSNKTARVFAALKAPPLKDAARYGEPSAVHELAPAEVALKDFIESRGNDLEPSARALMPEIADVLRAVTETPGARVARLTGAGPTCFALYESAELADAAARLLADRHPGWWARASRLG